MWRGMLKNFAKFLATKQGLGKRSRFGHRHGLQSITLTSYFYKNIYWRVIYVYFLWKYFSRQIYSYGFHIFKLNTLKVIHDLYSQCLTQTLSKTTSFTNMEGVVPYLLPPINWDWGDCRCRGFLSWLVCCPHEWILGQGSLLCFSRWFCNIRNQGVCGVVWGSFPPLVLI
jgi:hypothetical protein